MKFLVKRRQISEDIIEVLKIPVADPPAQKPTTGAQPNEGFKKLAETKAALIEKLKWKHQKN